MDQSKANFAFLLHKNIAFLTLIIIGLLVQIYPPHGWHDWDTVLFFFVSQVSFYLGLLTNMKFNGYGVAKPINQIARAPVVPDFGLTWRGYTVKPLARMVYTALVAVAMFFVLFPEQGYVASLTAPTFIAYASAKLFALAGEIYVWMMADRHRHWYLVESRLYLYLKGLERPPKAIDAVMDRARQAQLLITTVRKF